MPIANFKPTTKPVTPYVPNINTDDYQSITCCNRIVDLTNLVTSVGGSPWVVDEYFSQQLDRDNPLHHQDAHLSPSFQQYTKIIDLELLATQGLTTDIDPDTSIASVIGEANSLNILVPNVGDAFVVNLYDNHRFLFTITETQPLTYRKDTHYSVSYKMVEEVTATSQSYIDLKNKTAEEFHYEKTAYSGNVGLLMPTDLAKKKEIAQLFNTLHRQYFREFLDRDTDLLLMNTEHGKIHDHHLSHFVRALIGATRIMPGVDLRQIVIRPTSFVDDNLWDILQHKNLSELTIIRSSQGLVNRTDFRHYNDVSTLQHLPIEYVVAPIDVGNDDLVTEIPFDDVLNPDNLDLSTLYINTYTLDNTDTALIKPVLADEHYVLSEAFYNGTGNTSVLEIVLNQYLNDVPVDVGGLLALYRDSRNWHQLERYYYIPLILLLARVILD